MRIAPIGHQASLYFLKSALATVLPFTASYFNVFHFLLQYLWLYLLVIIGVSIQYVIYTKRKLKSPHYQFNWRAGLLGHLLGSGIIWIFFSSENVTPFGLYMIVMTVFHFSEFMMTAVINPRSLKIDSFLLNHSVEYGTAACCSWLEFFIESYFFPSLKQMRFIAIIGLLICLCGEVMRKTAMYTAGSNFNHIVQTRLQENHQLITHGVYSICRHPSYVGWYYWAIGTQIILVNPICLICYSIVSWNFFKSRIEEEELTLIEFFGNQYIEYKEKVSSGLPFIDGFSS